MTNGLKLSNNASKEIINWLKGVVNITVNFNKNAFSLFVANSPFETLHSYGVFSDNCMWIHICLFFYDIQNRLYINSTCKMYTFNPNVNWFLRVLKNESLNICFEMLFLTKKKIQKKEKKIVFLALRSTFSVHQY